MLIKTLRERIWHQRQLRESPRSTRKPAQHKALRVFCCPVPSGLIRPDPAFLCIDPCIDANAGLKSIHTLLRGPQLKAARPSPPRANLYTGIYAHGPDRPCHPASQAPRQALPTRRRRKPLPRSVAIRRQALALPFPPSRQSRHPGPGQVPRRQPERCPPKSSRSASTTRPRHQSQPCQERS